MPKVKSKFNDGWKKEFPYITSVKDDENKVSCKICATTFIVASGGRTSIRDHAESARYKQGQRKLLVNCKIDDFYTDQNKIPSSNDLAVTAKELAFAYHSGKHRSSLRTSECTSSLVRELFEPKFTSAKTKVSKLVQKVITLHLLIF